VREIDRSLVPVMTVCDEELSRNVRRRLDAPQTGLADLDLRLRHWCLERDRRVAEKEDRLGLHPLGTQERETLCPDVRMRALVRKHRSRLVRLRGDRDDQAVSLARHSVGPDVPLDGDPCPRVVVPFEDAAREPFPVDPRALLRRTRAASRG
jgi:hypothetical protein